MLRPTVLRKHVESRRSLARSFARWFVGSLVRSLARIERDKNDRILIYFYFPIGDNLMFLLGGTRFTNHVSLMMFH